MESLGGAASRGGGTGPSEDECYPVNSSCPSTSRALSIPHIRERIFNLAISRPMTLGSMSSFCKLRAVGRAWQETAFEWAKNQDMPRFRLPLTTPNEISKTEKFMATVTPDALLPLVPAFNTSCIDVSLATRFAKDYSHIFVGLRLFIEKDEEARSGLDKKLEVFQGLDLCSLETVEVEVDAIVGNQLAPAEELKKVLDAIDRLAGSVAKLRNFVVDIDYGFAPENQIFLRSRVTQLFLERGSILRALVHPRNTFFRLKSLDVYFWNDSLDTQTYFRYTLERCRKLEQLCINGGIPPLSEAPLSLPLPQLDSLEDIFRLDIKYDVEAKSGSDILPNLTMAMLDIELYVEEGEVTVLAALGRLLRNANNFTLGVRTSQIADSRMVELSECFSNVTRLFWRSESDWEDLVLPLSHVFLRMTCLQHLETMVSGEEGEPHMDVFRFLTGLEESEIPEETILNGRRDVLTNLRRLRSLTIMTMVEVQPLSPILFQAVFSAMPELTEIQFYCPRKDIFQNVEEMVTAWRDSGRQIWG